MASTANDDYEGRERGGGTRGSTGEERLCERISRGDCPAFMLKVGGNRGECGKTNAEIRKYERVQGVGGDTEVAMKGVVKLTMTMLMVREKSLKKTTMAADQKIEFYITALDWKSIHCVDCYSSSLLLDSSHTLV